MSAAEALKLGIVDQVTEQNARDLAVEFALCVSGMRYPQVVVGHIVYSTNTHMCILIHTHTHSSREGHFLLACSWSQSVWEIKAAVLARSSGTEPI